MNDVVINSESPYNLMKGYQRHYLSEGNVMKKSLSIMLAVLFSASLIVPVFAQEQDSAIADLLSKRSTSHRAGQEYKTAPLSDKIIDLLMKAGFSAPTGGNQHSLNFYVITERARMDVIRTGHPYSVALQTAPCLVVIAGDEAKCKYPELHEMDAGIAAMAMVVEATKLGLTTCVMSIFPQPERVNAVRASVNIPKTMKPVLMVAFGYPATDATTSASVTYYSGDQIHNNGR